MDSGYLFSTHFLTPLAHAHTSTSCSKIIFCSVGPLALTHSLSKQKIAGMYCVTAYKRRGSICSALHHLLCNLHLMLNNLSLNELGVLVLLLGFGGLFLKRLLADRRSPISNIPGPSPKSWLNGNLEQLFDPVAGWDFHESLMKRYGNTALVHGSFGQKILYTYDPKAMHSVLLQQNLTTQSPVDKPIFEESDGFIQSQLLIFGNGLLGTIGHQHRKQRKMLNPMFSLTHLREMGTQSRPLSAVRHSPTKMTVPVLFEIAHKMENALKTQSRNSSLPDKEINILSWLGRASLEMIGEAGLGYSFDPMMDESSSHPFSRIMKDLLPTIQRMLFLRDLLPVLVRLGTPKLRRWVVGLFPWKDLHDVRDMIDYMHSVASDIYNSKKRPLEQNINMPQRLLGTGKDLISILMKENERAATDQKLDKEEVISLIVYVLKHPSGNNEFKD
ncbi:hypothetical protein D9757_001398 [Collybiopsis confluens]|uniref:Cytochrome P450 n=1 Tax=Collybiopsis confluens TaxID=2823264 RepID=A0A8H5HZ58_9AGAR|nr:hypothetical protein D9757_001398 [Collybiopsis confluens]